MKLKFRYIIGCPRTITKSSSSSSTRPLIPTFLHHIMWLNWFFDVKQLVFSTFYCLSASFFFFLTSPTHPPLKVNKILSNLSGSHSCSNILLIWSLDTFSPFKSVLFATTAYLRFTMLTYSVAPIHKVKDLEVQFSILSLEEIVRIL